MTQFNHGRSLRSGGLAERVAWRITTCFHRGGAGLAGRPSCAGWRVVAEGPTRPRQPGLAGRSSKFGGPDRCRCKPGGVSATPTSAPLLEQAQGPRPMSSSDLAFLGNCTQWNSGAPSGFPVFDHPDQVKNLGSAEVDISVVRGSKGAIRNGSIGLI